MVKLNSKAPVFTLPDQEGKKHSLKDYLGKWVVLYFYPKDNTPACTLEAQDFSALAKDFAMAGATVIGISKDSVKKHDNFCRKHDLRVILASDEQGQTCEDYGVWVEKSMYGRSYMGIERTTLLIDGTGRVEQVWNKVKVAGHAEEVLAAVRDLAGRK